jgi:hypothetical protein
MKKKHLPTLSFILLILVIITYPFNFAYPVVPGWHNCLIDLDLILIPILALWLLLLVIAYRRLAKRITNINMRVFLTHFLLTLPYALNKRFYHEILTLFPINEDNIFKYALYFGEVDIIVWILFMVGQAIFAVYFVKVFYSKKIASEDTR